MKNKSISRNCIFLLATLISCTTSPNEEGTKTDNSSIKYIEPNIVNLHKNKKSSVDFLFDTLLCEGFDFPVGNKAGNGVYTDIKTGIKHTGWYKAVKFCEKYEYGIHPAEDWNGIGGGNTDLGQKVFSIGKGIVINAENAGGNWGKTVVVEHLYYENGKVKKLRSFYMHLDSMFVKKGDFVSKRLQIGTLGNNFGMFLAHLHLELRKESLFDKRITFWPTGKGKQDIKWIKKNYEHPTKFINEHRTIKNPVSDSLIVIAVKHKYRQYIYKYGDSINSMAIALGQQPLGHKKKQGDNRTPEGEYYINQKSLGPFSGDWSEFFGTAWIRISYPNSYDAENGLNTGLITSKQCNDIKNAIKSKGIPPKNTAIGGGIGFHGWAGKWDTGKKNNLTWGCISINNDELLEFYNSTPINTKIIIIP